ncbi:MAG: MotA/TolQ/ExbB proton channel family protein [Bacteroidales bacterium]|jgi:biopolymer transport protein ExbB
MKKVIAFLSLALMLNIGMTNISFAQEATEATDTTATEAVAAEQQVTDASTTDPLAPPVKNESFHQLLKNRFIEGGPTFMTPILLCLIFGLALCIERIIYLNLADVNPDKLLVNVEKRIQENGINDAKELCRDSRGPVASIMFQGLDRYNEGLENVEKAIVSYGGVQIAKLEKNLSWIGLFIAISPSLGFLGTVVGMVQAFDAIEIAGDISPTIVAGGMKIALITTVFGLIVAIILQIFYNYIISKIDGIVADMEDASITFMDILVRNKNAKN